MSAPVTIRPQPLTDAAFAPYGTVIETAGAEAIPINQGTTTRFHALAELDTAEDGGRAILSVFRATSRPAPIALRLMERHPLGSQAFVPLVPHDWLVVVSPAERPGPADLVAFHARGDQGVQYARNVWHHPLLVLVPEQDFLIADRAGPGENLEEVWFADGAHAVLDIARLTGT
ncbi:ureidoglycolate lyase [Oceanibacterium hippocampi]|uniref:Ureidoglycolate lyase n=1 Tax=Oceanibacterium hippocampi TaxID=745714 RepID=A0A1Y5TYR7_9PROT|nr:ureidoglycolate lyase [Oceanibacterium hippocampi]SLN76082.1 Ureidoglycolate lyase [Oceanibacterium hippocampi]